MRRVQLPPELLLLLPAAAAVVPVPVWWAVAAAGGQGGLRRGASLPWGASSTVAGGAFQAEAAFLRQRENGRQTYITTSIKF